MSDYTTSSENALYAELEGRESTLGLGGMTAKMNDREIIKIRRELESRDLPTKRPRGPRSGSFYVLSFCDPPFDVGVLHTDPRCSLIDEHAAARERLAEVRVATPEEVARQPGCKVCEARP
jgi:hypothetical protein